MPKLFIVTFMDDCEVDRYLTTGENEEEVKKREEETLYEELSCLMWCEVDEISEIDGYKVKLIKDVAVDPHPIGI